MNSYENGSMCILKHKCKVYFLKKLRQMFALVLVYHVIIFVRYKKVKHDKVSIEKQKKFQIYKLQINVLIK